MKSGLSFFYHTLISLFTASALCQPYPALQNVIVEEKEKKEKKPEKVVVVEEKKEKKDDKKVRS